MVKFVGSEPHKYFVDVLEYFGVQVHKYYVKRWERVKFDPDRYCLFIAKITFEGKTGYIFGPECGDAFTFPELYFYGELHKDWDEEVSDLEDYPKEYNEELDVKYSVLKKSFDYLLYGWSKKELKSIHWGYRCDKCSCKDFKGNLYTCKKCKELYDNTESHDDDSDDQNETYDLCEDCYNKKEYVHEHENFEVISEPEEKPDIYEEEVLKKDLKKQYEDGYVYYGKYKTISSDMNRFWILNCAYFEDENAKEKVYNEILNFFD